MTTVIGSSRLILFASLRDLAIGARMPGIHPSSSSGLPSVFGDEHPRRRFRRRARKVHDFGEDAQLRDGERPQLHFEGDKPLHGGVDGPLHGAFAFVGLDGFGDFPQHAQQEGAGARGRIGHRHRRRGQPGMLPETRAPQHLIDQPDHGADHFRRRVVRAGLLSERVVIDLEKVLVEIEPGVGVALADRRPVDRVQHARRACRAMS